MVSSDRRQRKPVLKIRANLCRTSYRPAGHRTTTRRLAAERLWRRRPQSCRSPRPRSRSSCFRRRPRYRSRRWTARTPARRCQTMCISGRRCSERAPESTTRWNRPNRARPWSAATCRPRRNRWLARPSRRPDRWELAVRNRRSRTTATRRSS